SDVLGVDREMGWSLSSDRYVTPVDSHPITADLGARSFDPGESTLGIVPVAPDVEVVLNNEHGITLATHQFGRGRSVYFAGLPWNPDNNRLLHRAIHWAASDWADYDQWHTDDARVEIAHYPSTGATLAYSIALEPVHTKVHGPTRTWDVSLTAGGYRWLE
ncbi:MAG: 1,3-beta-galactosyl-N-acetylhexosamine phosphorylase, partial [Propionibacteriaceae bacterium]|nr:1,3-beta-galactosyl-N-acetylhexosamine phosphorylase [Propionibacteriaceae bacterium]